MFKKIGVTASLVAMFALGASALGVAGNGGGPNKSSSSLSLVILGSSAFSAASTSTDAHWGDRVTFDLSTSASRPFVAVNCYQGGARVYSNSAGFYEGSMSKTFTLSSSFWTGGAAECTATLYQFMSNGKENILATTSFSAT
jgi:hypothetical protein